MKNGLQGILQGPQAERTSLAATRDKALSALERGSPARDKARSVPTGPGCYVFKDSEGYVLYVGKAKNLRNRAGSYFTRAAATEQRTSELVSRIADAEFHVVESELDALLLEHRLIKEHRPWYNSQMVSDRPRPYLRVTSQEPFASFSACFEKMDDGADYFDFFTSEEDIGLTLELLRKAFGVAGCGKKDFRQASSPCICHSLEGCLAPCGGMADAALYGAATSEVLKLLRGESVGRIEELKQEMAQASKNLAFERAGACKELSEGLERIRRRSRLQFHYPKEGGVLVLIRPQGEEAFSAFYVEGGRVLARADFSSGGDSFSAFAASYHVPNVPIEDGEWLALALLEVRAEKRFISVTAGKNTSRLVEKALRQFAKG